MIISIVRDVLASRQSIWSIKHVQDLAMKKFGLSFSSYMVRCVLREKFSLSYRKIKRVPFVGNSERNKVLRSLYAQEMLKVYKSA